MSQTHTYSVDAFGNRRYKSGYLYTPVRLLKQQQEYYHVTIICYDAEYNVLVRLPHDEADTHLLSVSMAKHHFKIDPETIIDSTSVKTSKIEAILMSDMDVPLISMNKQ